MGHYWHSHRENTERERQSREETEEGRAGFRAVPVASEGINGGGRRRPKWNRGVEVNRRALVARLEVAGWRRHAAAGHGGERGWQRQRGRGEELG